MRSILECWMDGISYLITDDLISFYAFFTTILAEVAFLWASGFENALAFTIVLMLCILNVIVCAFLKGEYEGFKKERIVARIYVIIFIILFLIGLFIKPLTAVILFAIPIAITALWIWIRGFQDSVFVGDHPKIILLIANFIHNPIIWLISQIIVIGLPMFMFIYFLYQTPLAIGVKFIIAVMSIFVAPLFAFIEDNTSACNIFELAYDIWWSEENENKMRELEREFSVSEEVTKETKEDNFKIEEKKDKQ